MIIEPLKGRFAVRSECCNSFKFLGLQLNQIGTLIYNIVMTDGSGSLYQRVGGRRYLDRWQTQELLKPVCPIHSDDPIIEHWKAPWEPTYCPLLPLNGALEITS